MSENCEKFAVDFNPPEPPEDLFDKIMCRIDREKKMLTARRRIIIFSVGLIGSMIAFVPALGAVRADLAKSGFATFFSLIFSDTEIVLAYWQNFVQSLLETLPVMGVVTLLAIAVIFLESLKLLTKDIKNIYSSRRFKKA